MPRDKKPKITAMAGTTFSDYYMRELKESFKKGLNNGEACLDANISERTFYSVLEKNERLKEYFNLLQKNVNKIAKQNIVKKIEDGDIEISKWWSERKNKEEFSTRSELTGKDGEDLGIIKFPQKNEDTLGTTTEADRSFSKD